MLASPLQPTASGSYSWRQREGANGREDVLVHQSPLGFFNRRKRARFGAPKAITATARKLGCLIYRLIKTAKLTKEPNLRTPTRSCRCTLRQIPRGKTTDKRKHVSPPLREPQKSAHF